MPGSRAGGAIIKVTGITGGFRGLKAKRPDGKPVRPSLVIVDDPQTDESARSLSQCATREAILAGAVLGLAGPGEKIAGVMPCTVIRPGDMADKILDRDLHPEWNGERTRMVYAFPTNEQLWAQYAQIRADGLRAGDGGAAATELYRQHRAARFGDRSPPFDLAETPPPKCLVFTVADRSKAAGHAPLDSLVPPAAAATRTA